MENNQEPTPEAVANFWKKYMLLLNKQGVKSTVQRWYVLRAEQYIKAHSGLPLRRHTAATVTAYFQELGRIGRLEGWQFRQIVHAIQILFCELLSVPWKGDVDWAFWLDSAKTLDADHPTIAREHSPEEKVFIKEKRGGTELDRLRREHLDLVERLAAEIRQRGYSIRTEEAYEQWMLRFIAFCGEKPLKDADASDVHRFLEDLAVRRNVAASTQNQALNALVFVFGQVLGVPLGEIGEFARAKSPLDLMASVASGG